ncbi:unnamed protein product [Cuscuta europaea]|uniref:Uncharacterized protein n=1 Tax=Cuscuta europaea TaxID=41803 RepID=A0A9P1E9V0_CUSEU|nr:unnamed protein product [Cuscuta europaea]
MFITNFWKISHLGGMFLICLVFGNWSWAQIHWIWIMFAAGKFAEGSGSPEIGPINFKVAGTWRGEGRIEKGVFRLLSYRLCRLLPLPLGVAGVQRGFGVRGELRFGFLSGWVLFALRHCRRVCCRSLVGVEGGYFSDLCYCKRGDGNAFE